MARDLLRRPPGKWRRHRTPEATRARAPGDARSVTIKYIGMHVGGGPNDAATKAPFERALEGAFGAIRECCESVGCGSGTFGLDLLIPKTGGHAELTNPRTALAEPATRCITAALGEVQFASPRHGATKLSYSIRIAHD